MATSADISTACDHVHKALTIAQHPPAPNGGGGAAGGQSKPPMPTSILDAKLDLKKKLSAWANLISEEGQFVLSCPNTDRGFTDWIDSKADWFAGHPASDDFLIEIGDCVKALRRPYATKDERKLCANFGGIPIYAWPWEDVIRLPDGTVARTYTLRQELRAKTLEFTGHAANVSAILREVHDLDIPADSIRAAGKRGTLPKHGNLFNVQEVKERFATQSNKVAI